MPRPKKVTDAQLDQAAERVARGETREVIAAELGISAAGLGQRLKKRTVAKPKPKPKPKPTPEAIADAVERDANNTAISPDELRTRMSEAIRDLEHQASDAELTDLEKRKIQELLVKTYSAYQRVISRDDPDMLSMRREDIKARADQLRALFVQRAESGRPQHCEACGVKLAQSWAREVSKT